jgi:PPP family 3-phenylpropionic acid transporter
MNAAPGFPEVDRGQAVALRLYYLTVFAALGVQLPFFPRWLEARGIEGIAMGAVTATVPAMGLIGPPLFGLLADTLGLRGSLLRVAAFVAGTGLAAIAAAALLDHTPGFAGVFAAVAVSSLFRSVLVMMGDVVALEQARASGRSYGSIRLWGSVGFLGGALGAGQLIDPAGPVALPLAMAAALYAACLASFGLPQRAELPPGPSTSGAADLLRAADFRLFLGMYFLAQVAHSNYDLCFSLHLLDLGGSPALAGQAWSLGVACEIVLMAASGRLLRASSPQRLAALALLGATVRWLLIGNVRSLPVLLALQPLHVLSFSLLWISAMAWIEQRVPPQRRATGQGLFTAATAGGIITGMLLWGSLYREHGGSFTFQYAALVAGAALLACMAWSLRTPALHGPAAGAPTS